MTYYVNKNNNLDLLNNDLFFSNFFNTDKSHLSADIIETDKDFEIIIDVPGFSKQNIKISLENKQLTVSAIKEENKDDNRKYLRKERLVGSFTRKFYVGDVKQEDIKASIEDGILTIKFSKESYKKVEENKFIEIN